MLFAIVGIVALLLCAPAPAAGSDSPEPCRSWQSINPLVSSAHLYGAAYGGERWVAVGEAGTVMESPDRVSWSLVPAPTAATLRSVAWTGGRFVAVGDGGVAVWSDTALDWHVVETGAGRSLFAVAAGPEGIVAVGEVGVVATSLDGSSWDWSIPVAGDSLFAVTWTGDQWVAAGDRDTILTSPDAVQWTPHEAPWGVYTGVAGNGSIVVAVGIVGDAVSSDGVEWIEVGAPFGKSDEKTLAPQDWPRDVLWCRTRFVRQKSTSSDGVTWNPSGRDRLVAEDPLALACGPDGMLGVGAGGQIAISDDEGGHWRAAGAGVASELMSLAWNGSRLVAAAMQGNTAVVLSSADGVFWREADLRLEVPLEQVVGGEGGFVAFDDDSEFGISTLSFSPDGIHWDRTGTAPPLVAMTWDGTRWVALAWWSEQIGISSNGTDWWFSEPEEAADLRSLASNQETIVAVGAAGAVELTTDGSDWRQVGSGVQADLGSVAWGGGVFVAVGSSGTILRSTDGETWQTMSEGTGEDLWRVVWAGESFVAVGRGGTLVTSADGVVWQSVDLGTTHGLVDVSPNGSGLTVIGAYGLMMRSACPGEQDPLRAAFAWQPRQPRVDQPVWFTDLSLGEVSSREWDFGDGGTASAAAVVHAYASDGGVPVSLRVVDEEGASMTSAEVVVHPACAAPEVPELTAPQSVDSGGVYEVSWSDTGADRYVVEASASPLFRPDAEAHRVNAGWTHSLLAPGWLESEAVFLRVRAENVCDEGTYESPWSEARQVAVEPALARIGSEVLVIPAAGHGAGVAKTEWRSDVVLHNPHDAPVRAALFFLDGDAPEGAGSAALEVVLGAHQSRRLADVVRSFVTQGDATGAILIASQLPLVAASRTFNEQPEGSFGQFIAAVPLATAIESGEQRRLIQLERSARMRTNVGFANPGATAVTVRCELTAADGALLGSHSEVVGAWDHVQVGDIFQKIGVDEVADAVAVVSSETEGARFFAYASVVDNGTGDPVAMVAAAAPPAWRLSSSKPLPGFHLGSPQWMRSAHGAGLGVAVGLGAVAWSADGRDWTLEPVDGVEWLAGVACNGERWVAVGSGAILTSTDGKNWTSQPWDAELADVVWTGEHWVAVGFDGSAATSTDGVSWSRHQGDRAELRRVVWTGESLVAVGRRVVATSSDGVTWVHRQTSFDLDDLAFDGTTLVAAGRAILTSSDGETWEQVAEELRPDSVLWTGSAFVALDFVQGFVISETGAQWRALGVGAGLEGIRSLAWDGSSVVALGSDGRVLWLQQADGGQVIPVAANGPGNNGSSWHTDLELHNPGSQAVDCVLELLERGRDNSRPRTAPVSLPGGASVRYADALAGLFGFSGVAGLRAVCSGDDVNLASRTSTASAAGTFGQFIPAFSADQAIFHHDVAVLPQLAHSAEADRGFRTSLGLLSNCAVPMQVDVQLLAGDGALIGVASYDLQPYQLVHRGNVFARFTNQDQDAAAAVAVTPTVPCSFFAYASVVDNRTNDPIFVPAQRIGLTTSQPVPSALVFDNRVNSVLVDALPQAVALAAEGRFTLSVSGHGSLGRPDQPARAVCLYTGEGGVLRADALGPGESFSDVAAGPLWCFIPDRDQCGNNAGSLVLEAVGEWGSLQRVLDTRDNCLGLGELATAVSGDGAGRYVTLGSGDLGAPLRGVQLLVLYQDLRNGLLRSRVLRVGERLEWVTGAGPVVGVVLDAGDRDDNTGITQLVPF